MTNAELLVKIASEIGVQPEVKELLKDLAGVTNLLSDALEGDMVLDISPETLVSDPLSTAWTRTVVLTLQNAAGETHEWCNLALTTRLSIADGSTAGTASIVPATTLTFASGVETVVVSGDAEDWLNTEDDTLTVADLTILGYTVTGGTSVETFTTP